MITKTDAAAKRAAMFPTKIDLPEESRRQVIELLNGRLSLATDLAMQAKLAHWNVKGPNFEGLHELFEEVAQAAYRFADDLAERAAQLGGVADATVQVVAGRTTLGPYPLDIFEGRAHVHALSTALAGFARHMRSAISETADLDDEVSVDLVTEISRAADKLLWMVEAHLHTDR